MRLIDGGTVHIPLRHIYLCVIVLAVAYFLAREVSLAPLRRHEAGCRRFLDAALKRVQESVDLPSSPKNVYNPNLADQSYTPETVADEVVQSGGEACWSKPYIVQSTFCPDCYRGRAYRLSKLLQQVPQSTLRFPRGPTGMFRLRDIKQQSFIEDFVITPRAVCRPDRRCPYLLAVQLSVTSDVERRQAVRMTWGSVAKTKVWPYAEVNGEVQLLFVLAHQKDPKQVKKSSGSKSQHQSARPTAKHRKDLQREADTHGDILYIDMQDSYFNLTLKLLSAFKWVQTHCTSIKFVLKVDADTFVNVPMLLDLLILNEERLKFSVVGKIYTQERVVHRHKKWAVNASLYPPPTYPVYASGCNYVMSAAAVGQLVDSSPYLPLNHESTFLGPDFYATGAMGVLLSFDFFHLVGGPDLFGSCNATDWNPCDMVSDNLVFGAIPFSPGNLTRQLKMWRSFIRYY